LDVGRSRRRERVQLSRRQIVIVKHIRESTSELSAYRSTVRWRRGIAGMGISSATLLGEFSRIYSKVYANEVAVVECTEASQLYT
jgi:hypothetical protein